MRRERLSSSPYVKFFRLFSHLLLSWCEWDVRSGGGEGRGLRERGVRGGSSEARGDESKEGEAGKREGGEEEGRTEMKKTIR